MSIRGNTWKCYTFFTHSSNLLTRANILRGVEWSLRAFASMPNTAIFASTSRNKKCALRACEQLQKFGENEQASTRLNFASKSSKGKILRAVKNFNGPFITPILRVVPQVNKKWYDVKCIWCVTFLFFLCLFHHRRPNAPAKPAPPPPVPGRPPVPSRP